jgi:1-phosphatidylinositol phosphodiesterase
MNDIVKHDFPTRNWMAATPAIDNLTLAELTLPGTHNSGCDWQATYDPAPGWVSPIFGSAPTRHWAACQHQSFLTQLNYGARALDVRLLFEPRNDGHKKFMFHHNSIRSSRMLVNLLFELDVFLQDNPDEFIVLNFQHFEGINTEFDYKQFNDVVLDFIGARMIPVANTYLTLAELKRASPVQRVLVGCPRHSAINERQFHDSINGLWSGNNLTNASELEKFISRVMISPPSRWSPWSLSATAYSALGGPTDIHSELDRMFDTTKNNWAQNCNIISVDFMEESKIVAHCRNASIANAARKQR